MASRVKKLTQIASTVISRVRVGTDAGIVVTGTVVVADSMAVFSTHFKLYVYEQYMDLSPTVHDSIQTSYILFK